MNEEDIQSALGCLAVGDRFRTPDDRQGATFTIINITDESITIQTQNGTPVRITREAFLAAHRHLQNHGHDHRHPCAIRSNNAGIGRVPCVE